LKNRVLVGGGSGGQGGNIRDSTGDTSGGTPGKGGGATGGPGGSGAYSGSGSESCGGAGGAGGTQTVGGAGGIGAQCERYSANAGRHGKLGFGGPVPAARSTRRTLPTSGAQQVAVVVVAIMERAAEAPGLGGTARASAGSAREVEVEAAHLTSSRKRRSSRAGKAGKMPPAAG
jgi:hypothetical protein